jgi:single-strand DNA-binding protein
MNKVVLVGRLTAKPELRYTPQNTAYARFTVAVNRSFTSADGKREADFINVVAWRKQAETISKYFDKGNLIALEGRLQTGSYDDKDGNKRYTVDVALDNFEFVESKAAREASTNNSNNETPYDYTESAPSEVNVEDDPFAEFGDSVSIDDNFLE